MGFYGFMDLITAAKLNSWTEWEVLEGNMPTSCSYWTFFLILAFSNLCMTNEFGKNGIFEKKLRKTEIHIN